MRNTETSHFWVGHFPAALRVGEYFAEVYGEDDEDTPISLFARDQGVEYYDHDCIEYGFSEKAVPVEELFAGYSYHEQWAAELTRRVADLELTGVNMFVFINQEQIEKPGSVQGDGYWLRYLGTIKYRI